MRYFIGNKEYDLAGIKALAKEDEKAGILSGARVIADSAKKEPSKKKEGKE